MPQAEVAGKEQEQTGGGFKKAVKEHTVQQGQRKGRRMAHH